MSALSHKIYSKLEAPKLVSAKHLTLLKIHNWIYELKAKGTPIQNINCQHTSAFALQLDD